MKGGVVRPVVWVRHQEGLLDVVNKKPAFSDLCIPVVESSGLWQILQRVHEAAGITLNIEVAACP